MAVKMDSKVHSTAVRLDSQMVEQKATWKAVRMDSMVHSTAVKMESQMAVKMDSMVYLTAAWKVS
jgi:hypothetical protein